MAGVEWEERNEQGRSGGEVHQTGGRPQEQVSVTVLHCTAEPIELVWNIMLYFSMKHYSSYSYSIH